MRTFNSKILLFGEHTVLYGSDALLIPFTRYSGKLDFASSKQGNEAKWVSHKIMVAFSEFVVKSSFAHLFNCSLITKELSEGLYFNSNIPIGYGVGSSGALVAAFYHEFVVERNEKSIDELSTIFPGLESYFHGSSSGLDPLVSYLDKPLYQHRIGVGQVDIDLSPFNAFIIDTGITRSTQSLVSNFKTKAADSDFESVVIRDIVESTNQCVSSIQEKDVDDFFTHLGELSALQFKYLQEFIPVDYRFLWKKGLNTDDYYLKLCGAGGGGYLLGFAKNVKVLSGIKNLILL